MIVRALRRPATPDTINAVRQLATFHPDAHMFGHIGPMDTYECRVRQRWVGWRGDA